MSTREPRVYYPQYVLIVFLFAGFKSVSYVLPDYVGLGLKLHTCILFFTVYGYYMIMNVTPPLLELPEKMCYGNKIKLTDKLKSDTN